MDYPDCMGNLNPEDIPSFASEYLDKIRRLCKDENIIRITDKLPYNFKFIGFMKLLFPNAKIIHCRRNPLDACLSIYFLYFGKQHKYSFDLENLGHWYKDYLRLTDHWNSLFGNSILEIEYDDTVNNPEQSARKLIEYCGLDWTDDCNEFHKVERRVKTASHWQVRQPIYKSSLDRWKRYDRHIGPLKEILAGYY